MYIHFSIELFQYKGYSIYPGDGVECNGDRRSVNVKIQLLKATLKNIMYIQYKIFWCGADSPRPFSKLDEYPITGGRVAALTVLEWGSKSVPSCLNHSSQQLTQKINALF